MVNQNDVAVNVTLVDIKYRRLLLWSVICSAFSYSGFIVITARIYQSYLGPHLPLLVTIQLFSFVLMSLVKLLVWNKINFKRKNFTITGNAGLLYTLNKLTGQRKLICCYLIEITLSLLISGLFFSIDIKHGFTALLEFMAPVIIISYASGFYFLTSFSRQLKKFEKIKTQADHFYFKNISQN